VNRPSGGPPPESLIPVSAAAKISWPAIPGPRNSTLLALLYQFDQSQHWTREEIELVQLQQLSLVLDHAYNTVPFQRRRLQPLVDQGRRIVTFDDLQWLPITRRADLQQHFDEMCSNSVPRDHLPVVKGSTSGSTGAPVRFLNTKVTQVFAKALLLRSHLWHGRDLGVNVVSIQVPRSQWDEDEHEKTLRFNSVFPSGPAYRLSSTEGIDQQLAFLQSKEVGWLITYPSNLADLARAARDAGLRLPRLRYLSTLGEVVTQELRDLCREVWGLPVVDFYSCKEANILALQCPEHEHYHVQSERVIVEVLDDEGRPCAPGETGRVVVTDLHNYAMPLIRYEIGDYAVVGDACSCGRSLPVLKSIQGRARNMLLKPTGERFWPRGGFTRIAQVAPVTQMQFVQHSLEEIELKLVVSEPLGPLAESQIIDIARRSLGESFNFTLTYVESIPRSAGGKFEDFISHVPLV
jgi:phenylacetate-CoA ligase